MSETGFIPPSLVLATVGLSLATFMQVLDTTIANVVLPTISGNLGASAEQGTWVITSFAVCNAIALPLTGWMVVYQQMRKRPVELKQLPMDYTGLLLLVVGVGALQIVLDKGNDLDWFESEFIIVGSALAAVALAAFVIWELTDLNPVVNLRLFAYRNFTVGTLVMVVGYAGFFSINLLLPQWLQAQMGYTATWAGLAAAPTIRDRQTTVFMTTSKDLWSPPFLQYRSTTSVGLA